MADFIKIPAVFMRGGTSKGAYLLLKDLPEDSAKRDQVILNIYGSPDSRQINGIGGADPLTSKVALIAPSKRPNVDVDYTFGYVGINEPMVDYEGNCGNISSGVGPFAIEQGIVQPQAPLTKVRIYNTNTKKIIEAEVPVEDGQVKYTGDYAISGVPGTGAKIKLNFENSAGAKTGKLLPTGHVRDTITLQDGRLIEVSLVDAANPSIFVKAADIGFTGKELPSEREKIAALLPIMEDIRTTAAVLMGLAPSKNKASGAIPKVAIVAPAQDYTDSTGTKIAASEVDLLARTKALKVLHKTYAVTGAICLATAAMIEGTVVNNVISSAAKKSGSVRIGHPAGILEAQVNVSKKPDGSWQLAQAGVCRTARPIMSGNVYVDKKLFTK